MSSIQESGSPDEVADSSGPIDRAREALAPVIDPLWRHVLDPIRRSATLSLATMGAVFFLLGAAINEGVWAAILAIWGAGLFLIGMSLYSLIWLKRR